MTENKYVVGCDGIQKSDLQVLWDKPLPNIDELNYRDPTKLLLIEKEKQPYMEKNTVSEFDEHLENKTISEKGLFENTFVVDESKAGNIKFSIPDEERDSKIEWNFKVSNPEEDSCYEQVQTKPNPEEEALKSPSKVGSEYKMEARRYNNNKIRHELIPTEFIDELAKVYTIGAEKYTIRDEEGRIIDDGADNWRKGLKWRGVLASIKRHINKFEKGEDYDEDYPKELVDRFGKTFHLANAAWGIATLINHYTSHPELDDRNHKYLNDYRVGLDIDDVVCDWCSDWCKKFGYDLPKHWHFSYDNKEHFASFSPEELDEFYLNLPRKIEPSEIPFNPSCYITSRSVPVELTKKWLQKNGFPTVPVYSVGFGKSKVDVAKEAGIDYFIDDSYYNFIDLNKHGICTFLLTTQHNEHYDVGYKRVNSLKEFYERFLK
jgi:hypothetical protein